MVLWVTIAAECAVSNAEDRRNSFQKLKLPPKALDFLPEPFAIQALVVGHEGGFYPRLVAWL